MKLALVDVQDLTMAQPPPSYPIRKSGGCAKFHRMNFNVDLVIPCLEYRRELRAAVPGREGGVGRTEGPTTTGGDEGGPDRKPDHDRKGKRGATTPQGGPPETPGDAPPP